MNFKNISVILAIFMVVVFAAPQYVRADGTEWGSYGTTYNTGANNWGSYGTTYNTAPKNWGSYGYTSGNSYNTYKYPATTGNSYNTYKYPVTTGNSYNTYQYPSTGYSYNTYSYPSTYYTQPIYRTDYSSYPVYSYAWTGGGSNYNSNTNTNNVSVNVNGGGTNTTVYDYCPNLPGNQPSGYDCYPNQTQTPTCSISVSNVDSYNNQAILTWNSTNANSANLTNYGSVATNGSRSVSANGDTTYTLQVYGNGGSSSCSATVRASYSARPSCDLYVSDNRVSDGGRVTLNWDVRNATEAYINQGIGNVNERGGSRTVYVNGDTTYRMTVRNSRGDEETCTANVRADRNNFSSVTFTGTPVNNPPVVYLSDVPYTGLEDIDPVLLSYWLMLIAGAGAGIWFLYTKGMIPTFAFASSASNAPEAEVVGDIPVEPTSAVDAFTSALMAGDTEGAIATMRSATHTGTNVEAFLEMAEASAPEALKARITNALIESRMTGIRGAKTALTA